MNAYLAQEATIADRHRRGLFVKLFLWKIVSAIAMSRRRSNQGLLKIMSKMGISIISAPIAAAYNFEAVGLSALPGVAEYFPGLNHAHFRHRARQASAEQGARPSMQRKAYR